MPLKEVLLGFIDNVSLPAIFSRKSENLKELRQPLLNGISNARRQFEAGQTRAPHRWWKSSNDVIAFTVKVRGNVFTINDTETNHIPSDRFVDFLDKFTDAVEAGEFDDELRNKGVGDAAVKIPRAKRASPKPAKAMEAVDTTKPIVEPPAAKLPPEAASPGKRTANAAKEGKTAAPKSKRKAVDAKTLHARAVKSAATRAANKAKLAKAGPADV